MQIKYRHKLMQQHTFLPNPFCSPCLSLATLLWMTHECDILPHSFKVQNWTKLQIYFLKNWFSINLFDSKAEYSIFSAGLSSGTFDPPPPRSIVPSFKSPTSDKWSWPTVFDSLHRGAATLNIWFKCLRCLWIHIICCPVSNSCPVV